MFIIMHRLLIGGLAILQNKHRLQFSIEKVENGNNNTSVRRYISKPEKNNITTRNAGKTTKFYRYRCT